MATSKRDATGEATRSPVHPGLLPLATAMDEETRSSVHPRLLPLVDTSGVRLRKGQAEESSTTRDCSAAGNTTTSKVVDMGMDEGNQSPVRHRHRLPPMVRTCVVRLHHLLSAQENLTTRASSLAPPRTSRSMPATSGTGSAPGWSVTKPPSPVRGNSTRNSLRAHSLRTICLQGWTGRWTSWTRVPIRSMNVVVCHRVNKYDASCSHSNDSRLSSSLRRSQSIALRGRSPCMKQGPAASSTSSHRRG